MSYMMTDNQSINEVSAQELIEKCFKAKEKSYSPYSNFPVGAALLTEDGTVITGCNVENASYGLSVCAERTAICKAVSEGHRKFKAIAVSSNLMNSYIVPCGMCRQVLAEFGTSWTVYLTKPDRTYKAMTVSELLPLSFTPDSMKEERVANNNTA